MRVPARALLGICAPVRLCLLCGASQRRRGGHGWSASPWMTWRNVPAPVGRTAASFTLAPRPSERPRAGGEGSIATGWEPRRWAGYRVTCVRAIGAGQRARRGRRGEAALQDDRPIRLRRPALHRRARLHGTRPPRRRTPHCGSWPNVRRRTASRSPPASPSAAGPRRSPAPSLGAAVVDRRTFNGTIIETGTDSYRLAGTEPERRSRPRPADLVVPLCRSRGPGPESEPRRVDEGGWL